MLYKNLIGTEIRKRRDRLGWSQSDLAVRLQLAGWDIDRSQLSKIECRLVQVSDFQQLYFVRVFKVTYNDLLPNVDPVEKATTFWRDRWNESGHRFCEARNQRRGNRPQNSSLVEPATHMTWEELVTPFISYQQAVHVVRGDGLDTVSLQHAPVAWSVSIKSSGGLNFGTYEGDDLRLVGTRTIPLMELEPGILRREMEEALEKQIVALFDPSAVGNFLKRMGGRRRF